NVRTILQVHFELCWKHGAPIKHFEVRPASQHLLFTNVRDRGCACQSWPYRKHSLFPSVVRRCEFRCFWPWAHNTHLPTKYVNQLRDLIDFRLAEQLTHPSHAEISRSRQWSAFLAGIPFHGSELEYSKWSSQPSHTRLPEDDRPAAS